MGVRGVGWSCAPPSFRELMLDAVVLGKFGIDIGLADVGDVTPNDDVAVARADLDGVTPPAQLLGGDDLRTAAGEGFITQFTGTRVLADGDPKDFQRLGGRMFSDLADADSRDVPYRGWIVLSTPDRLMWSDPSEETGFMLPGVPRASQDRSVLDPDYLLVNESAGLLPDGFDHRLASAGVPAVPGGVGFNRLVDGHTYELFVQVRVCLCIVPCDRIALGPILVLDSLRALRFGRMIRAVVVYQVGRIGRKENRALAIH